MAIKERKQITGTTAQINAYEGHEGQVVWDKEKKTLVGMSGTAGENYQLASKEYVDNEVAKKQPQGDYATNTQLTEGLESKEDKGVCLPKSEGTLLGGWVNLQSLDGSGTAQILKSDLGSEFSGVDIASENSLWEKGAILSLRTIDSTAEPGEFHLRTGKNPEVYFLRGTSDGSLSWKGREIVRTGSGNKIPFSIGASGASYSAPVTGRCVVAGGISGVGANGGNIELYNNQTLDQMSSGTTPGNGWIRLQINVRKGDVVIIHYYNWDKAEAFWVEQ